MSSFASRAATYQWPKCKSRRTSASLLNETQGRKRVRVLCLDCDNSLAVLYSVGGQCIGHPWEVPDPSGLNTQSGDVSC